MRLIRVDIRPSKKPYPPHTAKTVRDGVPIFRHPIPEVVFELHIQLTSEESARWIRLTQPAKEKIVNLFANKHLVTLNYRGQGQVFAYCKEGFGWSSDPVEVGKFVISELTKTLQG